MMMIMMTIYDVNTLHSPPPSIHLLMQSSPPIGGPYAFVHLFANFSVLSWDAGAV